MSKLSDEAIERRMTELRGLTDEFAKAQGERVYLDEFKKSKLAMLMKMFEVAGVRTTTAQERDARAHTEYVEVLGALRDATEIAERARYRLEIAKLGVSVFQTQCAMQRAEMRGYGA